MECPGYRPPIEKDLHFVDQTSFVLHKAGGNVLRPQSHHSNATKRYQWRNQFYQDPNSQRLGDVSNRHVHRVQLLSTFLDLYLPKCSDKTLTSTFDYIAELPRIDLASPLLQISIDTLCLVELGSLYRDQRCLRESQARYVRALPMLANELARTPSRRLQSDHLLAAITVLTLCELFDAIANNSGTGQGWISHVNGAQQYVKAIGTDGITSHFHWLLFHNVRHSSMCAGLVKRKAVFFAESRWLKVTREVAEQDQHVALYDITVQIPGVLEQLDDLLNPRTLSEDFAIVCAEISRLRSELDRWMKRFFDDRSVEPYQVVDVRAMKQFSNLCLDRTFQTVFWFDSIQLCSQQQLYWSCCLLLDFSFLAIHRLFSPCVSCHQIQSIDLGPRSEEDIERDMFVMATSYCRSVPYCCRMEAASVGRVGTFLLRIIKSYFEQSGHCRESEWCTAVRQMLQSCSEFPTKSLDGNRKVTGAPWNTKHVCKSSICNFRIECAAPAPLLLDGEYPNKTFKPRHSSREVSFGEVEPLDTGGSLPANPTSYNEEHVSTSKRKQLDRLALPADISVGHGMSALADERVLGESVVPNIIQV